MVLFLVLYPMESISLNSFVLLEHLAICSITYYTIIDFNEVDIRIYLPEKVIIHRGR